LRTRCSDSKNVGAAGDVRLHDLLHARRSSGCTERVRQSSVLEFLLGTRPQQLVGADR
jgi:hypothetical protein